MKNYFKKFSIMSLFIFLFLCAIGICNSNKAFAEEYLITPTNMTDSSSPSPFRADASSIDYRYKVQPWEAFNGTSVDAYDTWLSQSGESSNVWLSIDIGTRKIPSSYSFSTWNDSEMTAAPKDWNFEGSNDGVNWTILDKRINISGWNRGEEKKFNISNNSSSYSRFRINVLQNNGRSDVAIDNFKIYSDSSYDLEKNLSLNKYTDNLQVGQTDNLVVTTIPAAIDVTWKSSDSLIATVDSNGKVTGIKEGQAAITATTADGAIATCTVTVTNKSGTSGGNTTPTNPTDNTGGTSTGTDET
ncbi:Ig-like domain-containing protein, partial [Clostridium saccharobutylicum]